MAIKNTNNERRRNRIEREISEQSAIDVRQNSPNKSAVDLDFAIINDQNISNISQGKKDSKSNLIYDQLATGDNLFSNSRKTNQQAETNSRPLPKNPNSEVLLNIANITPKANDEIDQLNKNNEQLGGIKTKIENSNIITAKAKIALISQNNIENDEILSTQTKNATSESIDSSKIQKDIIQTISENISDSSKNTIVNSTDNLVDKNTLFTEDTKKSIDLETAGELYNETQQIREQEYDSLANDDSVQSYIPTSQENTIDPYVSDNQDKVAYSTETANDDHAQIQKHLIEEISTAASKINDATPPVSAYSKEVDVFEVNKAVVPSSSIAKGSPSLIAAEVNELVTPNSSLKKAPPPPPLFKGAAGGPPPPPDGLKSSFKLLPKKSEAQIKAEAIEKRKNDLLKFKNDSEKSKENIQKLLEEITLSSEFLSKKISITAKSNIAKNISKKVGLTEKEIEAIKIISDKSALKSDDESQHKAIIDDIEQNLKAAEIIKLSIEKTAAAVKKDIEQAIALHEQIRATEKIIAIRDEIEKIYEISKIASKDLEIASQNRVKLFEAINNGTKYNDGINDIVLTPNNSTTQLGKIKNSIKEKGELIYKNKIETSKKLKEVEIISNKYKGNTKIKDIEKEIKLLDDKIKKDLEDTQIYFSEEDAKSFKILSKELTSLVSVTKVAPLVVPTNGTPPPPPPPPGSAVTKAFPLPPSGGPIVKKAGTSTTHLTDVMRKKLEVKPEIISILNKYTNNLSALKDALKDPIKEVLKSIDYDFTDESLKKLKSTTSNFAVKVKKDQLIIDRLTKVIKPLKEMVTSAKADLAIEKHRLDFIKFKKEGVEKIELSKMRIEILEKFIFQATKDTSNGPNLENTLQSLNGATIIIGKFIQGITFSEKAASTALKDIDMNAKTLLIKMNNAINKIKTGDKSLNEELAELSQELNLEFLKLNTSVFEIDNNVNALKKDKDTAISKLDKDPNSASVQEKNQAKHAVEIKFNEKIEILQSELGWYRDELNKLSGLKADLIKGLISSHKDIIDVIDHPENHLLNKKFQLISDEVDQIVIGFHRNLDELNKKKIGFDKCFIRYRDKVKNVMKKTDIENFTEEREKFTRHLENYFDKLSNKLVDLLDIKAERSKLLGIDKLSDNATKAAAESHDNIISKINEIIQLGETIKLKKNSLDKDFSDKYISEHVIQLDNLYKVVAAPKVVTKKLIAKSGASGGLDLNAMKNTPQAIAARKQKAIDDLKEAKLATIAKFTLEDQIARDLGIDTDEHKYTDIEKATSLEELQLLGGVLLEV